MFASSSMSTNLGGHKTQLADYLRARLEGSSAPLTFRINLRAGWSEEAGGRASAWRETKPIRGAAMTHPLSNPPEGSCFVLEQTPEGLYRIRWKTPGLGYARF